MAFPLYLDEDSVNRALIRALRARGMDVTNAVDAGREEGGSHAGLILAPQQRYPVGEQRRRILRISSKRNTEEMRNQVEFLSRWGLSAG